MDSTTALPLPAAEPQRPSASAARGSLEPCEECLGTGGWYRYDPLREPGVLYLSCLQCRGTGLIRSLL